MVFYGTVIAFGRARAQWSPKSHDNRVLGRLHRDAWLVYASPRFSHSLPGIGYGCKLASDGTSA